MDKERSDAVQTPGQKPPKNAATRLGKSSRRRARLLIADRFDGVALEVEIGLEVELYYRFRGLGSLSTAASRALVMSRSAGAGNRSTCRR